MLRPTSVRGAIALFGNEVSPRFCQAESATVYEWNGQRATPCAHAVLGRTGYPDRLHMLASHQVRVLLCGSFPCAQHPTAVGLGIHVVCGLSGPVKELVRTLGSILAAKAVPCDP